MTPNDAILALLAELRLRVAALEQENAGLQAQIDAAKPAAPPAPTDS